MLAVYLAGFVAFVQPYGLELTPHPSDSGWRRARLYSRRTGRTVWTRTIRYETPGVAWADDGRAVSILDRNWNLILWRDGEKVVQTRLRPQVHGGGEPPAYSESTRWSPDNSHILFVIPGTQGMGTWDAGVPGLFSLSTRRTQWIDAAAENQSGRWVDGETIEFTWVKLDQSGTKKKRHLRLDSGGTWRLK